MQSRSEHEQAALDDPALPDQGEAVDIWDFTSDSVAEILECADIAVDAILERAEQQVLEDIAIAEERAAEETERRRARLASLRHELNERALSLADLYGSIAAELEAVDRALAGLDEAPDHEDRSGPAVVKVRERHTYHFAGQPPQSGEDGVAEEDAEPRQPVQGRPVPWQDAA